MSNATDGQATNGLDEDGLAGVDSNDEETFDLTSEVGSSDGIEDRNLDDASVNEPADDDSDQGIIPAPDARPDLA